MNLLYFLDLVGTAAFAASGAWAAVRNRMDLFGVLVLGLVTATGGGTLRDLLLGDTPPFCLKDENYLYISFGVALAVFFLHPWLKALAHPLLYFDAVGLGTFVVIGTGKALSFHMGFLGAVMMGVMTATAGGMVRDVLSNQVPLILRREIYASACLAGAALLVLLDKTPLPQPLAALAAALVVIALRLLAIRYNWALPRARG
ncbi:membrane protein [Desulfuromonas versatilis]|uniref:Membrane protein n=1 Tax=Desulfuromonas versatilis TaxID=2802975 RepID=A0ABM8HVH0_9BACT|nr:trimeric intracellular cation channel family protein [Desulfuromonas versatilis]BCR05959.1 membrane protein [Desulfuromonas versatilis]